MNNNFFNGENNNPNENNEYDDILQSEEEEEEENQLLLPEIRASLMDENTYLDEYEYENGIINENHNEYEMLPIEEEEEQEEEEQEEPIILDVSINSLLNILWVPPENFNLTNFSFFNNIHPNNSLNNILSSSFDNDQDAYKNVLSQEGQEQLKIIKYNSKEIKEKVCPITREEFKENEEIVQLPCKHIFNKEAIKIWLETENAICPICRKKLKSKEIKNDNINENDSSTQPNTQQTLQPLQNSLNLGETFLNIINERHRQMEDEQLQQAIINSFNDSSN